MRRRQIMLGDPGLARLASPGVLERGVLTKRSPRRSSVLPRRCGHLLRDDAEKMKAGKVFGFREPPRLMMAPSSR